MNSGRLQLVGAKCSFNTPLCLVYEEENREWKCGDELQGPVVGQMREADHLMVWHVGLSEVVSQLVCLFCFVFLNWWSLEKNQLRMVREMLY